MKATSSFLCILLLTSSAKSESVPVACDQYFTALEVCMSNAISFYEGTNNKQAEETKKSLKEVQGEREVMKNETDEEKNKLVAEYCAAPESRKSMVRKLTVIMAPLIAAQSLNEDCSSQFQKIKLSAPQN